MRFNAMKFGMPLLLGLLTIAPSAGWGLPCNAGGPVLARPIGDGGVSEFTFQSPYPPPYVTGPYRWTLVDDFPEVGTPTTIRSGFINLTPSATKTELFAVGNSDPVNAGLQFRACTIRAQLLVDGPGTTTVHLVVKQGTTQVDGPPIYLGANYLQEYQSAPMLVNPTTPAPQQPWTSSDLSSGSIIIGVKNDPGTWGVGIASIVLECE